MRKKLFLISAFLFILGTLFGTIACAQPNAEDYAPIYYFEGEESCYPLDASYHIDNSDYNCLDTSEEKCYYDNIHGTINDDGVINHYKELMSVYGYTVYYRIYTSGITEVIQYWTFYAFNKGELNQHEGDWEMVQIVFVNDKPSWVAYSQHHSGQRATWSQVEKDGNHIKVYVSRGSHANYLRSFSGKLGIASDIVGDNGRVLNPSDYTLDTLEDKSWIDFEGKWGEIPDSEGDAIAASILGQAGPPGPKYREDGAMWTSLGLKVRKIVPLAGIRKVIAERMLQSITESAQLTITRDADISTLKRTLEMLNSKPEVEEQTRISYTDFFIRIVAKALEDHPLMNSTLEGEEIKIIEDINIGVAVATDAGLVVPVIRNANVKSMMDISLSLRELVGRARQGSLMLDEITGGTFTVSNLGMFGVETFTPILNPPETGILGIGAISEKLSMTDEGIKTKPAVSLSLTFDHRVLDGHNAAAFLQRIKELIEDSTFLDSVAEVRVEEAPAQPVAKDLTASFNGRVALNYLERLTYSHDIASLPNIVKTKISPVPTAVVRAQNIDDLKKVLEMAKKHNLRLTPRAAATSGFGGTVPTASGIVVHVEMDRILEIDRKTQTVTVEPSTVWVDLENKLREHGLACRVYPSSALSSTVGGFAAMDGLGHGGLEFGTVRENIAEVELLTPDGRVQTLSGENLDLAIGAQGITGFLTNVKLYTRPAERDIPVGATFPSAREMLQAFENVSKLKIWSIMGENQMSIKLKQHVQSEHPRGVSLSEEGIKTEMPEGWVALFIYPESRNLEPEIRRTVETLGGRMLDAKAAQKLFEERFYNMSFKMLGPSFLTADVTCRCNIPSEDGYAVEEIQKKFPDAVIEVTLAKARRDEMIMTCVVNILSDERHKDYTLGYLRILDVIQIAKKRGGSSYSTGLYFSDEAESVLGSDRLKRLWEFKQKVDPSGIMNPGKVIPHSVDKRSPTKELLKHMNRGRKLKFLSSMMKPLIMGKEAKNLLPDGLDWDAYACIQCGQCTEVCPLYRGVGWEASSPRGRFFLLREFAEGRIKFDQRAMDIFFLCTTCRRCNVTCECNIQIEQDYTRKMRPLLHKLKYNYPPFYDMIIRGLKLEHNVFGTECPNAERSSWIPSEIKLEKEATIACWAGCIGSFFYPNMPANVVRLFREAGESFTYLGSDEWCCGFPYLMCGMEEELKENILHNIQEMDKRGVKTIVTACPGCLMMWSHIYPEVAEKNRVDFRFKVKHITQYALEAIRDGKLTPKEPINLTLTYHDPCHLGRHCGVYEDPREILKAIPGVTLIEMKNNKQNCSCCGGISPAFETFPEISTNIWADKMAEVTATGASAVATICPGCQFNLDMATKMGEHEIEVVDVSDLLLKSLGFEAETVSKTRPRLSPSEQMIEQAKRRALAIMKPSES